MNNDLSLSLSESGTTAEPLLYVSPTSRTPHRTRQGSVSWMLVLALVASAATRVPVGAGGFAPAAMLLARRAPPTMLLGRRAPPEIYQKLKVPIMVAPPYSWNLVATEKFHALFKVGELNPSGKGMTKSK